MIKVGAETDSAPAMEETKKDSTYIFSYTSGTTGDSKGVKLTHANMLSSVKCLDAR